MLNVREIITCGYYGCGAVKVATEDMAHGLTDHRLEPIRRIPRRYAIDLSQLPGAKAKRDKLAEVNVLESVRRVCVILKWAGDNDVDWHCIDPLSWFASQTTAGSVRALEQFEGFALDALVQNEIIDYEIQTRKLSL